MTLILSKKQYSRRKGEIRSLKINIKLVIQNIRKTIVTCKQKKEPYF